MSTASSTASEPQHNPGPAPGIELPRPLVVALLLLVIIFFALIRYRLHDVPLERDEGEYAYSGQLLLQRIPPYQLAYNMKLPGIYAAYAAIMAVFGETPAGIHLGLLLLNAFTILALYFLAALLFGSLAGLIAAASYGLLSTSSSVMGFEAHATHFVALPAIVGVLLLLKALDSHRHWLLFASGLCGGVAVLMKQHGVFFVLFCLAYLLWPDASRATTRGKTAKQLSIYFSGVVVPYAITCLWLYKAGVFQEFWFWTVSYAGEYSRMGLRRAVHAFLENSAGVVAPAIPIWILAALGLSALWCSPPVRRHSRFILLLFLCSFLSLCPGAFFRPHYYILILPVTAMLVGIAVTGSAAFLGERNWRWLPLLVFLAGFAITIFLQRKDYFTRSPLAVFQETYPHDPFLAAEEVAQFIKQHSLPPDRIAVIGSEPEIYFYAHRHSATGYLYMYSLIVRQTYTQRMRAQFMQELETNRPEYVVYVDVWNSWGERQGAPQAAQFWSWLENYMHTGYERVGVAEIDPATRYLWGNEAATYVPHAPAIYVLRRAASAPAR